jgi:hypothetical protein
MSNGRFDIQQSARWHKEVITAVGDCEFSGLNVDIIGAGRE